MRSCRPTKIALGAVILSFLPGQERRPALGGRQAGTGDKPPGVELKKAIVIAAFAALGAASPQLPAQTPVLPHDSFTVQSAVMHEARRINVYTPPGYDAAGAVRYTVLYMPDGGVQEDFPHVTATVDSAIRAGQMRPVIVVGIENTERRRDMTGPTEVDDDRKIAPRVGGSAAFRAFIATELMPEVARRYRVNGERGIVGESLAGLFIVETFFEQPELFDTYVALSPSLWWNHDALVRTAAERLRAHPNLRASLFLSAANEEGIAPETAQLADILRANAPPGLTWKYEPRPDLEHSTIYRAMAPSVLRAAFPPTEPRE